MQLTVILYWLQLKLGEYEAMTVIICNQATSSTHTSKTVSYIKSWYALEISLTYFWFVPSMVDYIFKVGRYDINQNHHITPATSETIDQTNSNSQNTYNLQKQPFAAHLPNRQQVENQENHTQGTKRNLIWLLSLRSRLGVLISKSGATPPGERKRTTVRTHTTSRYSLTGMLNLSLVRLIRPCFYYPCCMTLLCLLRNSTNI